MIINRSKNVIMALKNVRTILYVTIVISPRNQAKWGELCSWKKGGWGGGVEGLLEQSDNFSCKLNEKRLCKHRLFFVQSLMSLCNTIVCVVSTCIVWVLAENRSR